MKNVSAAALVAFIGGGALVLALRVQVFVPAAHSPYAGAPRLVLAGTWQGTWVEVRPTRLTVEGFHLPDRRAIVTYFCPAPAAPAQTPGLVRVRAKVEEDQLTWSHGGAHRLWPSPDGTELMGLRTTAAKRARIVMARQPTTHAATVRTDLPPRLAGLLGTWQGTWEEVTPSQLVVYRPDERSAAILYKWDDEPKAFSDGMHSTARIVDGTLTWRYAGTYAFRLSADGARLLGTRELGGRHAAVVMTRVPEGVAALGE